MTQASVHKASISGMSVGGAHGRKYGQDVEMRWLVSFGAFGAAHPIIRDKCLPAPHLCPILLQANARAKPLFFISLYNLNIML